MRFPQFISVVFGQSESSDCYGEYKFPFGFAQLTCGVSQDEFQDLPHFCARLTTS